MTYGNEDKGLDDGQGGAGALGRTDPSQKDAGTITLDRGMVDAVRDGIESEKTGTSVGFFGAVGGYESPNIAQTMQATLGFVGRVLEHEMTHWGAYYNLNMKGANDNVTIPLFGINLSFERGKLFEGISFGNLGHPYNSSSNSSWAIAHGYTHIQYTVTNDRGTGGPTQAMNSVNTQLQMRAQLYHLQKKN